MGYIPTMPYFRTIPIITLGLLTPLLAPAQTPAPAPVPASDSATSAQNVFTETINKLRLRERIAARIEQDVDMLNQKFSLEGNYYKDSGHRVRIQLDLKGLGDAGSTVLQVCDGKVLWEFKKVLNMQSYRRRDILPILKRLEDPNLDETFRGLVITQLGFGGPEALLAGFQKAVKFDQFAVETIDGVESFVLGGTWKDRAGLMGPNSRPLSPTAPLPSYIPSNIRVFVDKANSWPYRIEMIGNAPSMLQEDVREVGPDGRPIPIGVKKAAPRVAPSRITLKYTLLPDSQIEPEKQFSFQPPRDAANQVEDDTEKFLADLDQFIQLESNRKKAEAAKAEGEQPILKAPIEPGPNPGAGGLGTVPEPSAPK